MVTVSDQEIVDAMGLILERCKVVNLGEHKDANEAHLDDIVLQQYFDRAKTQDPEELKRLSINRMSLRGLSSFSIEIRLKRLFWKSWINRMHL